MAELPRTVPAMTGPVAMLQLGAAAECAGNYMQDRMVATATADNQRASRMCAACNQ